MDYPFHVIVRGTNQQAIFHSDGDRIFFHRTLTESAKANGSAIHAYVFMSNHVHLLATGSTLDSISKTIQALGRRYVRYFNFLHERTGTLWQGRFHSSVVDTDRYFMICQRYIELNPVRAGICTEPLEYPWSSHRHYALGVADDLITPHSLHSVHDGEAYCRSFDGGVPAQEVEAIRDAIKHGLGLGDDAFRDRLAAMTGRRCAPARRGKPKRSQGNLTLELNKLGYDPN